MIVGVSSLKTAVKRMSLIIGARRGRPRTMRQGSPSSYPTLILIGNGVTTAIR